MHFKKLLDESGGKLNKIWVVQSSNFHNRSKKSWLHDFAMKMYSEYSKGISLVEEKINRALKTKIYKHMAAKSKKMYIIS